ncbi:MAG: CDP-glycerol glycerophosphotransferase family protein [Promethearchaeota archaeon]
MYTIKNLVKAIVNELVSIIAFLIPLDPYMIILANHGRLYLDSNNYYFLRYLKKRHQENKIIPYTVFMITTNRNLKGNLDPKNLRDLFIILRSKIFLITHGNADFYWTKLGRDPRRLFITLRHGTPLKATGVPAEFREWKYRKELFQQKKPSKVKKMMFISKKLNRNKPYRMYYIVGSELERFLYSSVVKIPFEQCIPIGFTRNDLFFSQSPLDAPWEELVKSIIDEFDKVILYAPTFRPHFISRPPYLPFLKDFSLNQLEQSLRKHNAILLYRYHLNTREIAETFDRKMDSPLIKNASFHIVPYVEYLLKYSDILITDYSGIIYDFLYLNRPIIALANDWKYYNQVRGFSFDFFKSFPGEIVKNFTDLLKTIDLYIKNPQKDSERRKFCFRLFRDFSDAKNAHRTYLLLQRLNK